MVQKVKQATNDTVVFSKRLGGMVFALSLFGLGVYANSQAHTQHMNRVYAAVLVFAGALNVVAGAVVLYRVLMHKES